MKVLIVESYLSGHYLEYINHIHQIAHSHPDYEFVFVLSPHFNEVKQMLKWPTCRNVQYDLSLPVMNLSGKHNSVLLSLKKSFNSCRITYKYIKKYTPDYLFSIDIMSLVPLLPFFTPKIKILGVVYSIFLRNRNSIRSLLANKCRHFMLVKSNIFKTIYILNDKNSVIELNGLYHTSKYKYLPDPYNSISSSESDFRRENKIDDEKVILSHIGFLTKQKGTLDILRAIKELPVEKTRCYCFVFAGTVSDDIREEFYSIVNVVSEDVDIIVKDEFCSYSFLSSLCQSSNALLIPYHDNSKSSGVIGYASQFGVPVICRMGGLLEEIVEEYQLGYLIKDGTPTSLLDAFRKIKDKQIPQPTKKYCETHSVDAFCNAIAADFNY